MAGDSARRPVLFLDVDGPLVPFGLAPQAYPTFYPTAGERDDAGNPLLARINPRHGRWLAELPCELVWATAWLDDANECVAPRLGLPPLPVVTWPEESTVDPVDGLHWKTRTLVAWADGRSFAWVDDEITDVDRAWVAARHRGAALLRRVDPRYGLRVADYRALAAWLNA